MSQPNKPSTCCGDICASTNLFPHPFPLTQIKSGQDGFFFLFRLRRRPLEQPPRGGPEPGGHGRPRSRADQPLLAVRVQPGQGRAAHRLLPNQDGHPGAPSPALPSRTVPVYAKSAQICGVVSFIDGHNTFFFWYAIQEITLSWKKKKAKLFCLPKCYCSSTAVS